MSDVRLRGIISRLALVAVAIATLAAPSAPRAANASRSKRADWGQTIRAFAEAHLQHTAWGRAHGRRDYELTLDLAQAEGVTVDDDALDAAAYLHDMGGLPPYA